MVEYELTVDLSEALSWFAAEVHQGYLLVRVCDEHARLWSGSLARALRQCYLSDEAIVASAEATGLTGEMLIALRLPDPGSTMAGDFGEILVHVYQAARALPDSAIGALKWRLKQDRTKPAPLSDVVQFVVPLWPEPSAQDEVLCAEVKTKSGPGTSTPITSAILDSKKDRTSRLARTLVWLRERAAFESVGNVSIGLLDRFINATEHPPATKRFRAVAVVCTSILEDELTAAPLGETPECQVIVIAVPDLRETYMSVFSAAKQAVPDIPSSSEMP